VWTLNPTPNNDNNTVAASADITANGNVLSVVLTNLSPSLSAPDQALSDLLINFTTDITSVSGFSQAGQLINVNANGTTTGVGGLPTAWSPTLQSGNLYLTSLTGGQPRNMIAPDNIGSPNAGVLNFNPYIDTTAQFTMTVPGASNLNIAGVQFSFGHVADRVRRQWRARRRDSRARYLGHDDHWLLRYGRHPPQPASRKSWRARLRA
jgi:hypothetical protein